MPISILNLIRYQPQRTLLVAVISMSCLSTIAKGQTYTVVVPSNYATTEAPGRADVSTLPNYRAQQVYAASEFGSLPPGPLWLTRIDYRLDASVTGPFEYPADRWVLKFSTTSKTPENLDMNFDTNTGPDEQILIDGPVTMRSTNGGPAAGPKVFDYGVDLPRPFLYDRSQGNLLWDLSATNSIGPLWLDFIDDPKLTVGKTSNVTAIDHNSPNADWRFGGHVVQFTFSTVPEPSSLAVAAIGFLGMTACSRRRRPDSNSIHD
jgi:hypothetical protein